MLLPSKLTMPFMRSIRSRRRGSYCRMLHGYLVKEPNLIFILRLIKTGANFRIVSCSLNAIITGGKDVEIDAKNKRLLKGFWTDTILQRGSLMSPLLQGSKSELGLCSNIRQLKNKISEEEKQLHGKQSQPKGGFDY
ncbi:hypothetical protein Bca101_065712 [Brassica carinata]